MRGFVPLKLGAVWFVLPAEHVLEVVGERPWIQIPYASAPVPGVMGWRGRAIVVFDVAALLDLPALGANVGRARTAVVEVERCTLAMPVDQVREVQEAEAKPLHATRMPHSTGEIDVFGTVAPVLDLAGVVRGMLGVHELAG